MSDPIERTALKLCEEALDQASVNRDAWLRNQCGDNLALYERVQQLLVHVQPTDFTPPAGSMTDTPAFSLSGYAQATEEAPPEMIGAYRVLDLIGRGGMGAVYKAERADGAFERTVAIKLVGAIRARSDAERRFTNEREILARMRHPNIAQLLDGGTVEERGYLVMEFIDGSPFAYNKGRSLKDTLTAFCKVCAAVQYAHNNLVLHRDIKPDNVLLDHIGEPKLLDFGIAKLTQDVAAPTSADVTGTKAAPLTLNYSAPERLLGEPATVSSDVYSLGVYLYVLLHGVRPYDLSGKTLPEAWKQLRDRIENERPDAFGDIGLIAQKAMHSESDQRYATAAELAADVQRFQNNLTVSARPPHWRYSLNRFVRRNKAAVFTGSIGLLALLSAFVLTTFAYIESARQTKLAQEEAATASQAVEFLGKVLSTANPVTEGQRELSVADILASAKQQIEQGDIESPAARAYIETTLAVAHDGRGEFETALTYAAAAVDRLDQSKIKNANQRDALFAKALALVHSDKPADAIEILARYKLEAQEADDLQSWAMVEVETLLGNAYEQNAQERLAAEAYNSALALASSLPDKKHEPVIVLTNNYGRLLHKQGNYSEAMSYYQQSLDHTALQENSEIRQAIILANMAGIQGDQKKWPEAIELLQSALQLQSAANNLAGPNALISRTTLANFQRQSGDLAGASQTIADALETASETLPEDHFITAYVQNVAALTLCDTSQWRLGLDYARRSRATRLKIMPPEHWVLASAKSVQGKCETVAGNYATARTLLTEALKTLTELRGADGTQTLQTKQRLQQLNAAEATVKQNQ